ncbi:monovalent cation/H+ antiporter complex subunit F [Desertimonas flava]|jgi:multisubunit Na+/H+ antiporter MnhF subunit|uniref:monovalent cation/H+ antiporter complex subunit F n=1 Tax=Desertimonas flava TaxID=2064846 RepID=UPI000E34AF17|nr:monovalent cation/H+ antiporter complex subunit F [Desertimonas flava]
MTVAALVLLVAAGACFLTRVVRGPSLADRVIAVDGLIVTIVAAIIVNSIRIDAPWYLDAAVVVAVVGFVGTSAGARFIERRGG